jgi:hypothetical protein
VKSRYGKQYPRKGWAQPLLIAVGVLIGAVIVVGVFAAGAALLLRHT